jgi:hypothetical protein
MEGRRGGISPKAGSIRAQIKGWSEGVDSADGGRGSSTATSASKQEGADFVWCW